MNIILASAQAHPQGVMDALNTAPWYAHLGAAALLGSAAYVLRELEKKRDGDSMAVEIVIFVLAFAALILTYQGVFGDS